MSPIFIAALYMARADCPRRTGPRSIKEDARTRWNAHCGNAIEKDVAGSRLVSPCMSIKVSLPY